MHHDHPPGVTTLLGAQVRYLVNSRYGYLAVVGYYV